MSDHHISRFSKVQSLISRLGRLSAFLPHYSPRPQNRRRAETRLQVAHAERLESRELLSGMSVGMNLDWITDYAPAWVFKDAFQQSRSWMTWDYNTVTRTQSTGTRPAHVDANGWPTQLETWTNEQGQLIQQRLQSAMYLGTNGAHPAGIYHAQWEGTGTITFLGDARVTQRGTTPDGRSSALLDVTPTNTGFFLRIDSMSSSDPIRNIHVWLPDYDGESFVGQVWRPGEDFSPFHPLFLDRLEPFDTIRYLQAASVITSDIVHWEDRRPVTHARQSTFATEFQNGMSPEYMIELANELDANAWFSMPHLAEDDYVRNFATLVRDTLEPNLTIYVEWSNEVWNWAPGFEGHYWARAQAQAEGVRIEDIVARETRRDFAIWTEVFAGQEQRLVRTVGGFTAAPGQFGWNSQVLQRMNGEFDALAVAPYIAPPLAVRNTYTTQTTVDQVLADTRAAIEPIAGMVRQAADLVRQYETQLGRDLQLISYEGGTHLDATSSTPYQRAFFEANGDPRLYEIVSDYLVAMEAAGLETFNYYKFTDRRVPSLLNNDFGTLNRMDQPLETAPRYRALIDYMNAETDPPPRPPAVVTIAVTDSSAAEAGRDPAVFTVTRSNGDNSQELAVDYSISGSATNGVDYETLTGRVTIPARASSANVDVRPIDDAFVESNESIMLTLLDGTQYDLGNAVSASATLTSNDTLPALPLVAIAPTDSFAAERNRDRAVFTVRRSNEALTQPLTVNYQISGTALNGSDYERLSGSVTIPANSATIQIVALPIDDTEVESRETIVLSLAASPNYRLSTAISASATLDSDDLAPLLPTVTIAAPDATAAESNRDPATFVVTRTGPTSQSLTVHYSLAGSATNGTDYDALAGQVVIAAGASTAMVSIRPVDDVVVEGPETISLTLQTNPSYRLGATTSGNATLADNDVPTAQPLPVLMVIANRDFYYREYAEPRAQLEAAGVRVVVAAARRELSTPHPNSGQGTNGGQVMPDITLAQANAANYSAIVFVGGYGASQYQYAFTGTYANAAYNGTVDLRNRVNQLINDFVAQGKLVTAICHGVSVLAWARVNGESPLAGRQVAVYNGGSPASNVAAATTSRWHSEVNGARVFASASIGSPTTRDDDVWIDGQIITAENFDSARQFGRVIAQRLGR